MGETHEDHSPHWSWTTKLVVAFSFVAILAWFILRFQNILGPILMAFILSYLFYPVALRMTHGLKLPWRVSVTLIYLFIYLIFFGLLTLGGLALIDQTQAFVNFLNKSLTNLPDTLAQLSTQTYAIGPFEFTLEHLDLTSISNQILSTVQPLFGQLTTLLGRLASSAASVVGWTFLVVLLSYFILAETAGSPDRIINLRLPGYEADLRRLGQQLGRIWNAFLRGQIIIIGITILLYMLILSLMGVRYSPGLAVLAGLAKFVPYAGPFIAWTTYGLVAYFQGSTIFNLTPLAYSLIVVGVALLVDNLFDNLVSPRIMAQALKVHPAAVLLAAIIGASILGLVGVVLAAPVLATFKLFGTYALRKMFDQDPWEGIELDQPPPPGPIERMKPLWAAISSWVAGLRSDAGRAQSAAGRKDGPAGRKPNQSKPKGE